MEKIPDVLIVEDNVSDADLIMRSLHKNNIVNNVLHLHDGQEALDYIFCEGAWAHRVVKRQPRVIFLDLKMPRVNGIEVLQKLKKDDRTKFIPVVILTSSKEDPDMEDAYREGANSYVVKPVTFADFVHAVSGLGFYWVMINQPLLNNKLEKTFS